MLREAAAPAAVIDPLLATLNAGARPALIEPAPAQFEMALND